MAFIFGLYFIFDITNDYVETCNNKISYKTSFISKYFGKENWEIFWRDIISIKSLPTSQGSRVFYFNTRKGDNFLIPQRLENFEKFKSFARKKALQSRSTLKWDNNN